MSYNGYSYTNDQQAYQSNNTQFRPTAGQTLVTSLGLLPGRRTYEPSQPTNLHQIYQAPVTRLSAEPSYTQTSPTHQLQSRYLQNNPNYASVNLQPTSYRSTAYSPRTVEDIRFSAEGPLTNQRETVENAPSELQLKLMIAKEEQRQQNLLSQIAEELRRNGFSDDELKNDIKLIRSGAKGASSTDTEEIRRLEQEVEDKRNECARLLVRVH